MSTAQKKNPQTILVMRKGKPVEIDAQVHRYNKRKKRQRLSKTHKAKAS